MGSYSQQLLLLAVCSCCSTKRAGIPDLSTLPSNRTPAKAAIK
jgi:hypothetical protein